MKFVTIRTFELPTDLVVARGVLEANGIECQTKDELTVQVDNFLSHAIGGVKLQVKEEDVLIADQLLTKGGFIENNVVEQNSAEKMFSDEGFQRKLKWVGVGLGLIVISFIALALYSKLTFSYKSYLVNNTWCMDYILKDSLYYLPSNRNALDLDWTDFGLSLTCSESKFHNDNKVKFPFFKKRNDNSLYNSNLFNSYELTLPSYGIDEESNQIHFTCNLPTKFELYKMSVEDLKQKQSLSDSAALSIEAKFQEKLDAGILPFPEYTFIDDMLPLTFDIIRRGSDLILESEGIQFHFSKK